MPQRKRAGAFLAMAHRDFTALQAMTGEAFAVEIFGFHAQQAVEKCLKAWVEWHGVDAPLTHNLVVLLTMLEDAGEDVSAWSSLVYLNSFAVQFRYEQFDESSEEIDRQAVITEIRKLFDVVDRIVG